MRRHSLSLGACVLLGSWSGSALAADYYVEPASGSTSGDGSPARPWRTLEEVAAGGLIGTTVKAGDRLYLGAGYHGTPSFTSGHFEPPIVVLPKSGAQGVRLGRVRFGATSGWQLSGVDVSPAYMPTPTKGTLLDIGAGASRVTVASCRLHSVEDASGWGVTEWLDVASNGISVAGDDVTLLDNEVRSVRFGISVSGQRAVVRGNRVLGFSADGLRGLGDDGLFEYNLVQDSYLDDSVDSNHDDGFQSWSVGSGGVGTGVVRNITLRGNVFINSEDPARPLKGQMQGLGCFDGMFSGWVVENNVVVTDHWHGISLYGALDSRIVNNTVIDNAEGRPGPPWIMVTEHKDGRASQNVVVRNNLTMALRLSGTNVVEDHNQIIETSDFSRYFVSPAQWDLRLLADAPAVDVGSSEQAPAEDLRRVPRPQGTAVDLGAYEWVDESTWPGPGGAGGEAGGAGGGASGTAGGGGAGAVGAEGGAAGAAGAGATASSADQDAGCGCSVGPGAPSWRLGDVPPGPSPSRRDGGCGCAVATSAGQRAVLSLGALALAAALRRRGRRGRR